MHWVGIFDFNRYICINLRRACIEWVSGGFLFFLKAFIGALFLTTRNLVNFLHCQRQGNDGCLWCVFMHLAAIGEHPNIAACCVFYIIA